MNGGTWSKCTPTHFDEPDLLRFELEQAFWPGHNIAPCFSSDGFDQQLL